MRALTEFVRLSREKRVLLLKAVCVVGSVRLGLSVLPFRTVRRVVDRLAQSSVAAPSGETDLVENVVWAVEVASRRIPEASCLTQALASQIFLRRRGYPAMLRIGVAPDESGDVGAHAWIELEGRIIIGGSSSRRRFVTLSPRTQRDDPAAQRGGE